MIKFSRLFFALALCVSLWACGQKQAKQSAVSPNHDVLLISIDTLRADYLRMYHNGGAETPNLEKFSEQAVLFKNVISQIPYTLPSHTTMLTGYYPIAHNVKDNVHGFLSKAVPTLGETFKKSGYETAGFVGSMVLSRRTGLERGFDYYDDYFSREDVKEEDLSRIERSADSVFASFQRWFDNRLQKKRFFAFVHFYDPHSPYDPPPQFAPAKKEDKELYKGEIRYVDSVLGKLFSYLQEKNAWNNLVILITSDHGELLGEHGEIGHGFFVYQSALKVPMLLRIPGMSGKTKSVSNVVQLVDVAPTLLNAAGLPATHDLQGETLVPILTGKSAKRNRLAFSESYFAALQFGISPLKSVQDDAYKFIDAPRAELYDLQKDPGESKNLLATEPAAANKLKRVLEQYEKKYRAAEVAAENRSVSSEEAERFAALGYLNGNVPETAWNNQKDPKDYIEQWNGNLEISYLVGRGKYQEALVLVKKMVANLQGPDKAQLPSPVALLASKCYAATGDLKKAEELLKPHLVLPEALNAQAEIYVKTGRMEEASQTFRKALDTEFSYFVLYNYALSLKNQGKTSEAVDFVNKIYRSKNENEARPYVAETLFMLGDRQQAEKMFLELIEERPWEVKWYTQLAGLYQQQGQLEKALLLLTNHYERFSSQPEYLLRLGILYKMTNRPLQEIETFKQMIRSNENDPRAYFYCAKALMDHKQDLDAVIPLTLKGFQLNPDVDMQIFGHYILADAYQMNGRAQDAQKETHLAKKLESL